MADSDLTKSNFEGAILSQAQLSRSDLSDVQAQFADLRGAIFKNAELYGTQFQHAKLSEADFSGAYLSGVDFDQTNLVAPQLEQIGLTKFNGAVIIRVTFKNSILSPNNGQGKIDFSQSLINGGFASNHLQGSQIFFVEDSGVRQQFLPYDFRQDQRTSEFSRLAYPIFDGTAFRFFDLRNAASSDISTSFGDGSVALPVGTQRPCQWPFKVLNDTTFFGYWRGWLNAGGFSWPPSEAIGNIRIDNIAKFEPPDKSFITFRNAGELLVRDVSPLTPTGWDEETQTEYPCTWPTAN